LQRSRKGRSFGFQEGRPAHVVLSALDRCGDALARDRPEVVGVRYLDRPVLGRIHDAAGDGVLALGLHAGGDAERFLFGQVVRRRDVHDPELAEGERAGLVEDDGVEVARLFEAAAVAHEQSAMRALRRGDGDDQGHGQAERVRAGDNQHRHDAYDGEIPGRADELPDDESDDARCDGHAGQELRGAVGQVLGARLRLLRLRHEAHDAGELGVLARAGDLHAERAFAVDRAGDHLVAFALLDRARLAGDHRLVEIALALAYGAVDRDALARAHEHEVARPKPVDGHLLGAAVLGDARGLVRQELGQLLERALRLRDRAHLDPVAQQHDGDQRRQLPPQRLGGDETQLHDPGEDEGDQDGQ
jgi:hypothetical protein